MNKSTYTALTLCAFAATALHAGTNVLLPVMGTGRAPVAPAVGGLGLELPKLAPNLPGIVLPGVNVGPVLPNASSVVPAQQALRAIEATLPMRRLDDVPVGEARGAGAKMSDAVTGESSLSGNGGGSGDVPIDVQPPVSELQLRVNDAKAVTDRLEKEVGKVIVGQKEMVRGISMAIIMREHVLLEGPPGVAKTVTAKAFAAAIKADNNRVSGTSDLEPSMITGGAVLQENPKTGEREFVLKKGPLFTNILLLDEINRMTPRAQAAVLEAMAEGRVTIDGVTYDLGHLTVIATQNPIEQLGTYPLPEAQQDRFGLKILVPQPTFEETNVIADRMEAREREPKVDAVTDLAQLDAVRKVADDIHMDQAIKDYITKLVMAPADKATALGENVDYAVYVRAAIKLRRFARIHAVMAGRDHVLPADVIAMYPSIMRQRIAMSFSAGVPVEALIKKTLETVK